jgi:hypothetical protein
MMFTGLCTGDTGLAIVDVTPMGMALVPIFEPLEWGRGGLRRARCGIIATAAIEVYATALIVSATATIAFVESTTTTAVVGATTATNWLSLLALALLLATTAAVNLIILAVLLLWVLEHASRGLVADGIAEHLNLPLHYIDGGIVLAQALLHGGISCTKVGNSICQGGCGCIFLYGVHAVAVL